ncbi:MAG: 30S ribosomal protein S6 [Gammaproteobacteria bacterium]|nr:30S ribosomal protein S6 [Gammaproteobacteria bacterium]|tara:strand:+ start:101 stop:562 length:462 start_codon:yes stop_codon:yes gene_type:complete
MNNYELVLILNPDLSSKFDDFLAKFEKTLAESKFKINKLENIGRRQLAYSILNHNKGHYSILQISGPSESAIELETKLKYDNSVIRHLLLKVDSSNIEKSLAILELRETKKAPKDEEESKDKIKDDEVETNDDENHKENATNNVSKEIVKESE